MSTAILARKDGGPWVGVPGGMSWKLKRLGWEVITAKDLKAKLAREKTSVRLIGKDTPPKPKA